MVKAQVLWNRGLQFTGIAPTGEGVLMDSTPEHGGLDAGPGPMGLVLVALGGCTGMDVVSILHKMKVAFDDFALEIEAERAAEHPKVYTKIHLTYKIWGSDVPEEKFKRAIELSQERYCSVSHMLKKAAELTWSYRINPAEAPVGKPQPQRA